MKDQQNIYLSSFGSKPYNVLLKYFVKNYERLGYIQLLGK